MRNQLNQLDPHFYILIINRMIVFFMRCFNRGIPQVYMPYHVSKGIHMKHGPWNINVSDGWDHMIHNKNN